MAKIHAIWVGILSGAVLMLISLNLLPVFAASPNLSNAFSATQDLKAGSLVSLDSNSRDFVELANTDNANRLVGVAVKSDDSLVALNPGAKSAQVATSGNVNVLVSTINGDIKVGDQVAVSAISGIGAKATPRSYVIGVAQSEFNSKTDGSEEQSFTDNAGKERQIQVGYLNLNIAISFIDALQGEGELTGLQKIGKALTGRVIPQSRLIISATIAAVALAAIVALVYASIYSSILSVGRNPLAKLAVFATLRSVLLMIGVIAALAFSLVFILTSI